MKAKVLIGFEDIHTGKYHAVNDVITVSKERFEEILKNGAAKGKGRLVEEIKAEPKKKAKKAE